MKFDIRQMCDGDYPNIAVLLAEAALGNDGEISQKQFRKLLLRNQGYCFVGTDRLTGRLAGCVFGAHDGAVYGFVYKLAVAEEFRHQGLGRGLVGATMASFKLAKIDRLFAHVQNRNQTSIKLFEGLGFEVRQGSVVVDNF